VLRSVRFFGLIAFVSCGMVQAQITRADDERAAGLVAKFQELTENVADIPSWVEDQDVMVYSKTVPGGHTFVLVDAGTGAKQPAFDQARVAAALNKAAHTDFKPETLPFTHVDFSDHRTAIDFRFEQAPWRCDPSEPSASSPPSSSPRQASGQRGESEVTGRRGEEEVIGQFPIALLVSFSPCEISPAVAVSGSRAAAAAMRRCRGTAPRKAPSRATSSRSWRARACRCRSRRGRAVRSATRHGSGARSGRPWRCGGCSGRSPRRVGQSAPPPCQ